MFCYLKKGKLNQTGIGIQDSSIQKDSKDLPKGNLNENNVCTIS